MSRPAITARHETPSIEMRELCGVGITTAGASIEVTYEQGDTRGGLAALERAYADVKRQITGMTTLVPGEHQED